MAYRATADQPDAEPRSCREKPKPCVDDHDRAVGNERRWPNGAVATPVERAPDDALIDRGQRDQHLLRAQLCLRGTCGQDLNKASIKFKQFV
jgi:hypothetical protein